MNPVSLNLDLQFPDRMFDLKFAVGTEPLVRVNLKANGTAITATGYTGQMVYAEYKDSDSAVFINSTATGASYLDFQLTATQTLQISAGTEKYFLQFLVTDDTGHTVEWNRGTLTLRASPGTEPVDPATLGTSLNWAGFSGYSNTGASGPYRAGTNVTFSNNADGSVNIAAAAATVADGDKGDVVVSSSGATWTVDALAIDAGKLASNAVTTAKILDANVTAAKLANADFGDFTVSSGVATIDNGAVTLAKMADLATQKLIGRHAGGTGAPQAVGVDSTLEFSGSDLRRAALTGDVTASAGSNATTLANTAVSAGTYGPTTLTVDAKGRLTAASTSSSAAIQSALGSVYLPLAGGTVTGTVTFQNAATFLDAIDGDGSALTDINAAELFGDIPAASFGETFVEWGGRSFHLHTSAEVGWALPFDLDNATRVMSTDAVSSSNTSAQSFVLRSEPRRLPRGFTAFKTTGTLTIDWLADDTTVADITGIELVGYSTIGGSKNVLYSDSTTRNVTTINVPETISIDLSAFSSSTVPTHIVLEVTGTIEDGKKMGILHAEVFSA